jgi:IS1 family transposase
MWVDEDKAVLALTMLCEGSSVGAVARVTGLHKGTLLKLLVFAGERVERFMGDFIQDVPVEDVECDEMWGFIARKERTKRRKEIDDPQQGDSYLWIGLDRVSKLVLAHHVSRRTNQAADAFAEKLERATAGRFQISTDAFEPYVDSLSFHLGTRTSHGTLRKEFGYDEEGERRYSPPRLTGAQKDATYGNPDPDRIGTSYVERWNLSLRTGLERMTRLTIAFSRCWRVHKAALALWIGYYNFVTANRAEKMPPAMTAGITRRPWSMRNLLEAAAGATTC